MLEEEITGCSLHSTQESRLTLQLQALWEGHSKPPQESVHLATDH